MGNEYAKLKHKNQRESSKERMEIFKHHCHSQSEIERCKLTTQKNNFIRQYLIEDVADMKIQINSMVKKNINPITEPLQLPKILWKILTMRKK